MKKEELIQWMKKYAIDYYNTKELPNGTLFNLKQCPFCDGAHNDGAFIIWNTNGNIAAKCHHASCQSQGVNFAKLYKLKTGNELPKREQKKQPQESIYAIINSIVEEGLLEVFFDDLGNVISRIISMDNKTMLTYPVKNYEFRILLQRLLYDKVGVILDRKKLEPVYDYLGILAYKSNKRVTVYKRICNIGDKIVYELDKDKNICVVITKDGVQVNNEEKICFYHSKYYANQVMPDFKNLHNGDWKYLITLINKHFNFSNNDQSVLFAIYLISSYLGTAVNHPIMSVSGQYSSGKSSLMKKYLSLVDPKVVGLGDIPKKEDDISLRISESYVNDFDNLSFLNKNISNLFCKCVSGGTNIRRTLFENSDQTTFDLKSIIILDGIDVLITQSDLLSRTIFFVLDKLDMERLKTEKELDEEFKKDKGLILALCFSILQLAMQDTQPIKDNVGRMADFTEWAVKIGRAMGYKDEYIIRLLKKNHALINQQALSENELAQTLLYYMTFYDKKVHTVAELLKILKKIAPEIQIEVSKLPKQPNALSRKLNEIQSNLAEEGITYTIVPKSRGKEITIKNSNPKRIPISIS